MKKAKGKRPLSVRQLRASLADKDLLLTGRIELLRLKESELAAANYRARKAADQGKALASENRYLRQYAETMRNIVVELATMVLERSEAKLPASEEIAVNGVRP